MNRDRCLHIYIYISTRMILATFANNAMLVARYVCIGINIYIYIYIHMMFKKNVIVVRLMKKIFLCILLILKFI